MTHFPYPDFRATPTGNGQADDIAGWDDLGCGDDPTLFWAIPPHFSERGGRLPPSSHPTFWADVLNPLRAERKQRGARAYYRMLVATCTPIHVVPGTTPTTRRWGCGCSRLPTVAAGYGVRCDTCDTCAVAFALWLGRTAQ